MKSVRWVVAFPKLLLTSHSSPKRVAIANTLLTLNLISTLYMCGLIWFVQIAHYPLFKNVGSDAFPEYQKLHQWRTTLAVGPAMLIEAFSSVLLARYLPETLNFTPIILGIFLILVIWFSTAFLQVPCHGKLTDRFDPRVHARLVVTNWIRTIAWTLRGGLVVWMIQQ